MYTDANGWDVWQQLIKLFNSITLSIVMKGRNYLFWFFLNNKNAIILPTKRPAKAKISNIKLDMGICSQTELYKSGAEEATSLKLGFTISLLMHTAMVIVRMRIQTVNIFHLIFETCAKLHIKTEATGISASDKLNSNALLKGPLKLSVVNFTLPTAGNANSQK